MRTLIISIAILWCSLCKNINAQPQLKLSAKHLYKVEKQSSISKKLALYRKFFKKDSIRYVKKTARYWQAKRDSLTNTVVRRQRALEERQSRLEDGAHSKIFSTVYRPWAEREAQHSLAWLINHGVDLSPVVRTILKNYLIDYFLQASQNDSLLSTLKQHAPGMKFPKSLQQKVNTFQILNSANRSVLKSQQSNAILGEIENVGLTKTGVLMRYEEYVNGIPFANTDSLKGEFVHRGEALVHEQISKAEGLGEVKEIRNYLGQSSELTNSVKGYQLQVSQLQDSTYRKEQAKKKAEELAMEYLSENPAAMKSVQRKMSLLMRKYSVVPNSNDLSTAVKRTSLKGKPLRQRLYFAANFEVVTLKPISLDFSPMMGYRFNTKLITGIGGNYRQTFSDTIPTLAPDVLGYKVFTSYDVTSGFFAYTEFDRNSPGVRSHEGQSKRVWRNAAFLGAGRKIRVHTNIEMTVIMMYNFLHDRHDPIYPRPWVVRLGFQTTQVAFLKGTN